MPTFVVVPATRTEDVVKRVGWTVERRGPKQKPAVVTVLIENEDDAWVLAHRIAKIERGFVPARPPGLKP